MSWLALDAAGRQALDKEAFEPKENDQNGNGRDHRAGHEVLARHLRGIQRHHAARQGENVRVVEEHESEQELVPGNHENIERNRGQCRQRQRQRDLQ
jgi:hypothetical protein